MEFLQIISVQHKIILFSLGAIDPLDTHLIIFDLDRVEPYLFCFQVLVTIKNLIIHWCIIYEGASTCVMYTHVWNNYAPLS